MNLLKILKDIGAVIVWPFTHAQKIDEVYSAVKTDLPPTLTACKELAKMFASASPDVLAAIAAKGFDLSEDEKSALDIKAIAVYVKDTMLPIVEKDFSDLKLAALGELPEPAAKPAVDPAPAVAMATTAAANATQPIIPLAPA